MATLSIMTNCAVLGLAFLQGCSGSRNGDRPHPFDLPWNDGLSSPECLETRPRPRPRAKLRQHVCWEYGKPTDRAVSASCRIDAHGRIDCWRDNLSQAPRGTFSNIDDNGFNACALDRDGRVVCWGTARRGWHAMPRDHRFVAVSVGNEVSPLHMGHSYACGLTVDGLIICWEEGPRGAVFSLDGEYQAMDAGNNTVCGITRAGEMRCLQSAQNFTERDPPEGTFVSLALGTRGAQCVVDAANRAHCWVERLLTAPPVVMEDTRVVRAGRSNACIVHRDGTMKCIGDAPPPPQLRVTYLSRPAGVFDNYCAIATDRKRYCWGDPTP